MRMRPAEMPVDGQRIHKVQRQRTCNIFNRLLDVDLILESRLHASEALLLAAQLLNIQRKLIEQQAPLYATNLMHRAKRACIVCLTLCLRRTFGAQPFIASGSQ